MIVLVIQWVKMLYAPHSSSMKGKTKLIYSYFSFIIHFLFAYFPLFLYLSWCRGDTPTTTTPNVCHRIIITFLNETLSRRSDTFELLLDFLVRTHQKIAVMLSGYLRGLWNPKGKKKRPSRENKTIRHECYQLQISQAIFGNLSRIVTQRTDGISTV